MSNDRQTFINNIRNGDEVEWENPDLRPRAKMMCQVYFIRDNCGIDPRNENTVVELVACAFPKNEDWYAEALMGELS
jgi:hypothetical protein